MLKIIMKIIRTNIFLLTLLFNSNLSFGCMCFSTGERLSGLNKICYYSCCGGDAALTISSTSLCPLTINN